MVPIAQRQEVLTGDLEAQVQRLVQIVAGVMIVFASKESERCEEIVEHDGHDIGRVGTVDIARRWLHRSPYH